MPLPAITPARLGRPVSRLGLGALPMGPLQRNLSVDEGSRVVRAAIEGGVTFIDTAALYQTYEPIARGLAGFTGEVVIATKTHAGANRALAEKHIEEARAGLNRDTLDIMLCHCGRTPYSRESWGPTLDVLIEARAQGKIRMVGVSCHSVAGVRTATSMEEFEVIHPIINLTGMGITDGSRDEMLAAIHEAKKAGKFLYAMKALAGGNLVPRREDALRFVWENADLDSLVLGMVTPDEVQWNLNFFQGTINPQELTERTSLHSKRISILEFLCKGCGACLHRCENNAITLQEGIAKVDAERCILCGYCAPSCPLFAIRMV